MTTDDDEGLLEPSQPEAPDYVYPADFTYNEKVLATNAVFGSDAYLDEGRFDRLTRRLGRHGFLIVRMPEDRRLR